MLKVMCEEHLAAVRAHADALGAQARQSLEEQLSYLEHFAGDTCECELSKDFAPWSFSFVLYKVLEGQERRRWFNGGLIYYGPRESGVGAPQLSVSLNVFTDAGAKARWEVHT